MPEFTRRVYFNHEGYGAGTVDNLCPDLQMRNNDDAPIAVLLLVVDGCQHQHILTYDGIVDLIGHLARQLDDDSRRRALEQISGVQIPQIVLPPSIANGNN